ncbi:MAG: acylphosphatase [Chloroflexi bacterium]|nr:acylphosphatase [Chloroflexota bacterium]
MKRLYAQIYGRVQGVGFRVFVLNQAQLYGITGTVRNVYFPKRYVEVVAEGNADQLEAFLEQLKVGPPLAHVDRVEVSWSEASGSFASFDII